MLKFYIPHKEPGEKVIMLLRRHWFVILFRIFFFCLSGILPLLLYFLANDLFNQIASSELGYIILVLFISTYYLYIWLFLFAAFVDYYLDIWIVTNRRILNIEQKGLFNRVVAEQRLYRIQDVASELKGILPTLFNYGTVHIQTAGEHPRFVFKEVSDPRHVAKKIMMMAEQSKKFKWVMEEEKKSLT